jgi:uncharacterized spore protein YtfJ
MENNVVEILKGVVGELKEIAKSETVIGKPVTIGSKTVIPVVRLSVGFGAGGGQGERQKTSINFGGGGGGGARIEPVAFIVLDDAGVSLLPMARGKWEGIIETIPDVLQKISKMKDKFKSGSAGDDKGDGSAGQKQ